MADLSKTSKPLITTKRLQLVAVDRRYAKRILAYYDRNQESFQKVMPSYPQNFLTEEYHAELLMQQNRDMEEGKMLKIYLFHEEDTEHKIIIGDLTLDRIARGPLQSCYLGYKLDEKQRGNGYMGEALETTLDFAFRILKLHRIEANIMPFNQNSIELAEKLGFKKEGFSPSYLKINGKWENHLRYALLDPEFQSS